MMPNPTLFNQSMASNAQQSQASNIPQLPSTNMHSNGSNQSIGNGSPQSNHSGGSQNDKSAKTWSKQQQKLGDQLYEKVFVKTGKVNAPKITGMLLKMGNTKAQQCIDNPTFLVEQIQIAKKLLESTEGLNNGLSPTSMLHNQQHSNSPKQTTPLMQRLNSPNVLLNGMNGHSPPKQYQTLNTTNPLSPNGLTNPLSPTNLNISNNPLSPSTPNKKIGNIPNNPLNGT